MFAVILASATSLGLSRFAGNRPPAGGKLPLPPPAVLSRRTVIPQSFDAREAFPACASVIGHVRDSGGCDGSWAVASTGTFNDRYCIAATTETPGLLQKHHNPTALLSAEDTLSCAFIPLLPGTWPDHGCRGGSAASAWEWFVYAGVSSGGDFNASEMESGRSVSLALLPSCFWCCSDVSASVWVCVASTDLASHGLSSPVCTSAAAGAVIGALAPLVQTSSQIRSRRQRAGRCVPTRTTRSATARTSGRRRSTMASTMRATSRLTLLRMAGE